MKYILTFICVVLLQNTIYGQDTLRLKRKPKVILKSWHPEFKEFPKLKTGENKILFTIIPDLEKTFLQNNDINLEVKNDHVTIEETEKINQYIVRVNKKHLAFIEFELWFDLGNSTILLEQNSKWVDIRQIYPVRKNRIMLQTIKLYIAK